MTTAHAPGHIKLIVQAVTLMLCTGCATATFSGWTYRDSQVAYSMGALPIQWHRFDLKGGNVAFRHEGGGSILANGSCNGVKDVPIDVLTNEALFGIEHKQIESQDAVTIDGRVAQKTHLTGALDGVPVELELMVLKKDNCTYDLQLAAGPNTFAALTPDFETFAAGFRQLPEGAR